ncbi:YibE/F family protein [Hathewaya histolytica]|uniref:YibE/F family protein n=1 Tax=Hathewaya histolytica TaxID=1498 RepID=UPI003B676BCF
MLCKENVSKIFILVLIIVIGVLIFIPTGFEKHKDDIKSIRGKGKIIEVDNFQMRTRGIVKTGTQTVIVEVMNGKFKGEKVEAVNKVMGKLELDKIFQVGDNALIVIDYNKDVISNVNVIDHYRINIEGILLLVFVTLIILISGWTGVKAIISFIFTIMVIWKVLIPGFLKGVDPIILSLVLVTIITFVIIFLVAGFTKKALVAFYGSMLGIITTCILGIVFGKAFNIHGAIVPFSESLLYSGYAHLDITKIFYSGIFIASSGAVMDVSMDISSALSEIVNKKPDIVAREAINSGINISKAILGTMTTTLLLAYSGGYTAMLMVFMAQGVPMINIINMTYVAGEILHTLVGSFGLITVAPFTALVGGIMFTKENNKKKSEEEISVARF